MVEHERLGKRTCWTFRLDSASVPHSNLVVREGSERIPLERFSAVLGDIQPPSQRWSGLSRSLFSEIRLD